MNKELLITKVTESSKIAEQLPEKIALLDGLDQQRGLKTVIRYGQERLEVDLREKILKLGLDLHYRQVTVAMQEDGGLVRSVGKMEHPAFLSWIKKKLAGGWQIYSCYEALSQWVLVRSQAAQPWGG